MIEKFGGGLRCTLAVVLWHPKGSPGDLVRI
jgi:hypothetical protein